MRVLVIVPAYNEARSLSHVLGALQEHAPDYDVCVVDDGSTDTTPAVAARFGARVLQHQRNRGIGEAVRTGFRWARDEGYDIAVRIDADGQHEPRFIERALAPIRSGDADFVIGSRFLQQEGFQSTALRRVGIRYLRLLLAARCGVRITDPTSGFRAAGQKAIELFARSHPPGYPEPGSIGRAVTEGLRVTEVPVTMGPRMHGCSSIKAWGSLQYLVHVSVAIARLPERG